MSEERKLELSGEIADQITLSNLKEHLEILEENSQAIMQTPGELPDHKKEDLAFDLRMAMYIKEVIKYFSV